jgi:16S rRNA (uracil1498-N3)-methyltransferase
MAHVIYQPDLRTTPDAPTHILVRGDEAHHAVRVKRLDVGDEVRVHDGQGTIVDTHICEVRKAREGWEVELAPSKGPPRRAPRPSPSLHVLTAPPKGDRLEGMIDALTQLGCARWSPLITTRTVVDPREGKLARLERTCIEALKQSGRAWLMEIGPRTTWAEALSASTPLILADASGVPYDPLNLESRFESGFVSGFESGLEFGLESRPEPGDDAVATPSLTLLVGPEGGFTPEELAHAKQAGAQVCIFGVHTLRIETAAIAAAAIMLAPR